MSYVCIGRKQNKNAPCKNKVNKPNDYCHYHLSQKQHKDPCKCYLGTGSPCPYEAEENGLCEYHQSPKYCQGTTILGDKCMKAIDAGSYCFNCKKQESVIMEGVKNKTNEHRKFLAKQNMAPIPQKRAISVHMKGKLEIPSHLKKVEIVKPDDCCICYESMLDKYISLNCGHYFHVECLSKVIKLECPMCRGPIDHLSAPRWVILRITENMKEAETDRRVEEFQVTQNAIQNLVREELLEMTTSEEEDFDQHISEGTEMGIMRTQDINGNDRVAVVFFGH